MDTDRAACPVPPARVVLARIMPASILHARRGPVPPARPAAGKAGAASLPGGGAE